MESLKELRERKPTDLIYHYTNAAGLIGICSDKSLWATSHLHLNDRKELRVAEKLLTKELGASRGNTIDTSHIRSKLLEAQETTFIASFSDDGDRLSQWRAYCPGGHGYALGFSQGNAVFNSFLHQSFSLVGCEYRLSSQTKLVKELIGSSTRSPRNLPRALNQANLADEKLRIFFSNYEWSLDLAILAASFKHKGFEEEGEWRLVSQRPEDLIQRLCYRPGRFGIVPFYRLLLDPRKTGVTIDQLVIGPTANRKASLSALKRLLSTCEIKVTKIDVSATPLRQ